MQLDVGFFGREVKRGNERVVGLVVLLPSWSVRLYMIHEM